MVKQFFRVLRKTVSLSEQILNSSAELPKKLVYLILFLLIFSMLCFFKWNIMELYGQKWKRLEVLGRMWK